MSKSEQTRSEPRTDRYHELTPAGIAQQARGACDSTTCHAIGQPIRVYTEALALPRQSVVVVKGAAAQQGEIVAIRRSAIRVVVSTTGRPARLAARYLAHPILSDFLQH